MKAIRNILLLLFVYVMGNTFSSAQTFQWLSRIGGPSYDPSPLKPDELVNDVATDDLGNVYVCGRTRNNSNINGLPISTYGGNDIYVAKFDCGGNLVWVKVAGNRDDGDNGISIALDGLGHIYVTGDIYGDSLTRPLTFFDTVMNVNVNAMFIAKLDTSGNFIWGRIAQTGSIGQNVLIDSEGMVRVLINCPANGELFPGININKAFYLARFDTSGNIVQMLQLTGEPKLYFKDVKMNADNEIFLIGYSDWDSVSIGGTTLYRIGPALFNNFYFFKLDSSAVTQWYIHFGSSTGGYCQGYGCALASNGDMYITGSAYNGLVLGPDTLYNSLSPTTAKDFPFVARVSPMGQILWARNLHLLYIARSTGGITVKGNDDAVISGFFSGPVIMGPDTFSGRGTNNLFVAEFSGNGNILGGVPVPTNNGGNEGEPRRTVCDAAGNVFFGGAFDGNLIVNGNYVSYSGGYSDGFLIKWGSNLCTVGIDDLLSGEAGRIVVYPNPAVDEIRLKVIDSFVNEATLHVFDMTGRLVLEKQMMDLSSGAVLNLRGLSRGVYCFKLENGSGRYSGFFVHSGE